MLTENINSKGRKCNFEESCQLKAAFTNKMAIKVCSRCFFQYDNGAYLFNYLHYIVVVILKKTTHGIVKSGKSFPICNFQNI